MVMDGAYEMGNKITIGGVNCYETIADLYDCCLKSGYST